LLIWNENEMKLNRDLHQICIWNTFDLCPLKWGVKDFKRYSKNDLVQMVQMFKWFKFCRKSENYFCDFF